MGGKRARCHLFNFFHRTKSPSGHPIEGERGSAAHCKPARDRACSRPARSSTRAGAPCFSRSGKWRSNVGDRSRQHVIDHDRSIHCGTGIHPRRSSWAEFRLRNAPAPGSAPGSTPAGPPSSDGVCPCTRWRWGKHLRRVGELDRRIVPDTAQRYRLHHLQIDRRLRSCPG